MEKASEQAPHRMLDVGVAGLDKTAEKTTANQFNSVGMAIPSRRGFGASRLGLRALAVARLCPPHGSPVAVTRLARSPGTPPVQVTY